MTLDTHNTNPVKTKPRRWFRFRLRTLLVMVTLMSVPLGWVGWELDQRRREKAVVAWIEEMGGYAYFHSSFQNYERSWWEKTKDKWLGQRVRGVEFGVRDDFFDLDVLAPTEVSDLSPLAELKNLEWLSLRNTQVSDLSPLAELKNLEWLYHQNTQVSDLSPLAELKNLEELWLIGTPVSDKQVQKLRVALPNCNINFWSTD